MRQKVTIVVMIISMMALSTNAIWAASHIVTENTQKWALEAIDKEKQINTQKVIPNSVAVLYFTNKTDFQKFDLLEKGLALMLMTDLSKIPSLQLVERVKMNALAQELKLNSSGLVDSSANLRLGHLLGVEHLIGGDIAIENENLFQLQSNLLKIETKTFLGQPKTIGKLITDLFKMEKELLFEIVKLLKIKLTPKLKRELLTPPITNNLQALLYYIKAVQKSDEGNYKQARTLYEKALEEDPGMEEAKESIQELQDLQLFADRGQTILPQAETYNPIEVDEEVNAATDITEDIDQFELVSDNMGNMVGLEADLTEGALTVSWDFSLESEKDRLNEYAQNLIDQETWDSINTNLEHSMIRQRDDWFNQKADAQAGKVVRDKNNHWVRIQQYILRPTPSSIQCINVCLRDDNISSMVFNTNLESDYGGDLRNLPWNDWLDSKDSDYITYDTNTNPTLASMGTSFSNNTESVRIERTFTEPTAVNNENRQYFNETISFDSNIYSDTPEVTTFNNYRLEQIQDGFSYVFGNDRLDFAYTVIDDSDGPVDNVDVQINDVWDALRVNEEATALSAPLFIGPNNLEMTISSQNAVLLTQPIDIVYIPMSRMQWKIDMD